MCNINILIRKNKNLHTPVIGFIQGVTSVSYLTNPHGEGAYFSLTGKLIKQNDKIDYNEYLNEIQGSNFILTHQRYSTSGFEVKYHHPFEDENFVLMHNGIMNEFIPQNKKGSDSYGFFIKFGEAFARKTAEQPKESREKLVAETLNELLKEASGSYSIGIYDKAEKVLYYVKNDLTSISFYRYNEMLFITTKSENSELLTLLGSKKGKLHEIEIESLDVIKVSLPENNEKISVKKIAAIEPSDLTYKFNENDSFVYDNKTKGWRKAEDKEKDEDKEEKEDEPDEQDEPEPKSAGGWGWSI